MKGFTHIDLANFDPLKCCECGGSGWVFEVIDEEKFPVKAPCQRCNMWCAACKQWVRRKGHEHE